MSKIRTKAKVFLEKIKTKRRLVILNEETFEEIFSFKLNILNVFVVASLGGILLVALTSYLIAFTTLREYIPGYASSELKQNALYLRIKSDSLETVIKKNDVYLESVKKVLTGDLEYTKLNKDSIMTSEYINPSDFKVEVTEEEILLREKVKKEEEKEKLKKKK